MVVFRAVENNAYLVRAANTGISAVVHPTGRVLVASDLFGEGILVETIRTRPRGTFYTRYGDVFAWLNVLGGVSAMMARGCVGREKGIPRSAEDIGKDKVSVHAA